MLLRRNKNKLRTYSFDVGKETQVLSIRLRIYSRHLRTLERTAIMSFSLGLTRGSSGRLPRHMQMIWITMNFFESTKKQHLSHLAGY